MKAKPIFKILLYLLLGGLLMAGGGYGAYRGYVYVRQVHLLKQAQSYLSKSNFKKAMFCLQNALRHNPNDVQACRLMADIAEAIHSPNAIIWRSRVVRIDPNSYQDRLALARAALVVHDYVSATNALAGVNVNYRQTAAYQSLAGALAAAINQRAEAEQHFLEAAKVDPSDPSIRLNLAVVRLLGTNATAAAEARASLEELAGHATNSSLRSQALRELALDAMRHRQTQNALDWSDKLMRETNATFADNLLRLDVLQSTKAPQFKPTLTEYQQQAAKNRGTIFTMAHWQMANLPPIDTLNWLQKMPPESQTNSPVNLLEAECYTMIGDWHGLQSFLKPQDWGDVEFLRRAFQSRALRGEGLDGAATAEWELTLKQAGNEKVKLTTLLRLTASWGWSSEGENLLWSIVNQFPDDKGAAQALTQTLFANGRTRPLMMLYSLEAKRFPSDLDFKNNVAITALLLDAQEKQPGELAREVYTFAPTNVFYATTYAFSLYLGKKNGQALQVMQSLEPKDLDSPSVAGYYGLMLKAGGDNAKAKIYLARASGAKLLPEERILFEKAESEM